ncbi:hypothetical protein [Methylobacterium sp. SD21]|uniref:hypothetical protein n=1 Tax=Methylobacterium litchii TaxID=3138810 RepID=UPI00313B84FE
MLMLHQIGVQTAQGKSLTLVCTEQRTFGFAPIPVVQPNATRPRKQKSQQGESTCGIGGFYDGNSDLDLGRA